MESGMRRERMHWKLFSVLLLVGSLLFYSPTLLSRCIPKGILVNDWEVLRLQGPFSVWGLVPAASRGFHYFPSTLKAAVPTLLPKGDALPRSGCRVGCRLPTFFFQAISERNPRDPFCFWDFTTDHQREHWSKGNKQKKNKQTGKV